MIVTIRLFARAKDLAGIDHVEVQVPVGATVGELRGCLASQVPCLASLVPKCAIALDADFAGDEQVLNEGTEIALLPPVSGG